MSAIRVTLYGQRERERVRAWLSEAPDLSRVTLDEPKRSEEQSDLFWSLCGDVAKQAKHHGLTLSKEDWRILFLDGWRREARVVPNLDGDGLVTLGRSSSTLSRKDMSEAIEYILAWCARNDIHIILDRKYASMTNA